MNQVRQRRLKLIASDIQQQLYGSPQFAVLERRYFFTLPSELQEQINLVSVTSQQISSKLYCILQFGYFKAKHLFFKFNHTEILEDVSFILEQYFPHFTRPDKLPSRTTQAEIKKQLLDYFHFDDNTDKVEQLLATRPATLVKMTQDPEEIFHDLVQACDNNKLMLPSYSTVQDSLKTPVSTGG